MFRNTIFSLIGIANFSVRKNRRSSRGKVGETRANDTGDVRPRDVDINLGAGRAENRAKPIANIPESAVCGIPIRLSQISRRLFTFLVKNRLPIWEESVCWAHGAEAGHNEIYPAHRPILLCASSLRFLKHSGMASFFTLAAR